MELRYLSAFAAVADDLHFGRAAKRLQKAQPALSQQIRQLERELGVQLFERNTRSVRLTPVGAAFLEPVRRVLDDVDMATRAAQAAGKGEFGRVTVGFAGASRVVALPLLTRAVRAAHPGIEFVIRDQAHTKASLERVLDRSLDLGFVRLPISRLGIDTRAILNERLICALPSDHRLARRGRVPIAELAEDPFVLFPSDSGSRLREETLRVCQEAGFNPTVAQEAPDSHTILALVAAGVGVTLTLTSCEFIKQPGLVFRPLAGKAVWLQSGLAWRTDNPSAVLSSVLTIAEQVLPTTRPPR